MTDPQFQDDFKTVYDVIHPAMTSCAFVARTAIKWPININFNAKVKAELSLQLGKVERGKEWCENATV